MFAWRITKTRRAEDLSGQGAAIEGGRWNDVDVPAVYMGLTPAICSLETFVHTSGQPTLPLKITRFVLPDDRSLYFQPYPSALPEGWNAIPADRVSRVYGTQWLKDGRYFGLIVPSAILALESVVVLNPAHPAIGQIRLSEQFDFQYDKRMFTGK